MFCTPNILIYFVLLIQFDHSTAAGEDSSLFVITIRFKLCLFLKILAFCCSINSRIKKCHNIFAICPCNDPDFT